MDRREIRCHLATFGDDGAGQGIGLHRGFRCDQGKVASASALSCLAQAQAKHQADQAASGDNRARKM